MADANLHPWQSSNCQGRHNFASTSVKGLRADKNEQLLKEHFSSLLTLFLLFSDYRVINITTRCVVHYSK